MRVGQLRRFAYVSPLFFAGLASGAPLGAGNVLVTNLGSGVMTEFTQAGTNVQSFTFPDFEGGFRDLRDAVVGPDGNVQAYNGTFNPQLSTLVPATGAITSRPFAGWSTVNNISYGGVGAIGDGVYVTDMSTAGAGAPSGVVRFSTSGGATVRFGSAQYHDLTIGGDGLLYAIVGSTIDVYDPTSNAFVRTVTLDGTVGGADIRGIAVAANGTIYAAGWNGSVYAVSSTGNLLNSRVTGASNLTDIDLNDSGQLLVGSRFGNVILTDTTLASQTSFTLAGGPTIHVAFTTPLSIPEPSAVVATMLSTIIIARRRRS